MKLKLILTALCLCLLLLAAPAAAAGGAGTSSNPYVIQTAAELQSMANDLSAYYILGNDIDLSGYDFTTIGSTSAPFMGSLDGKGYSIKNLDMPSSRNEGGFMVLMSATITDIVFSDIHIAGRQQQGIFGTAYSVGSKSTTIKDVVFRDCVVSTSGYTVGIIIGTCRYGGEVDVIDCTVINCSTSASENGASIIAGGVTSNTQLNVEGCTILNSSAMAKTGAASLVYGTMGGASSCTINNIIADNCIINGGTGDYTGVIASAASTTALFNITNCRINNCLVVGANYVGGIIGSLTNQGNIENCIIQNTTISGKDAVGGISGYTTRAIKTCNVIDSTIIGTSNVAGICPLFEED